MEQIAHSDILDYVKNFLGAIDQAQVPKNASRENRTILPSFVPPLPPSLIELPEAPTSLASTVSALQAHIVPYLTASSLSPRYYGFVTGGATPAALTADILGSIFDQNVAVHLPKEYIATTIEATALNMLVDLFKLPSDDWALGSKGTGSGVFTTGATASNVLGLALGREFVLGKAAQAKTGTWRSVGREGVLSVGAAADIQDVRVFSTLPHSSIVKAASIVGIGRVSVHSIISDEKRPWDIDVGKFEALVQSARQEKAACILAISAGEVNTGMFATHSLDAMTTLRQICDKHGIWIHVDGAFGIFARILMESQYVAKYQTLVDSVQGLEFADSITGDCHKMLNVPYDCGFFLTKHKILGEDVFMNGNAPYLTSEASDDGIQSPLNIGIENSRRFRALPVYATLLTYGRQGYVTMLVKQITLARKIVAWLWDQASYEVLPKFINKDRAIEETYMIVLFRAKKVETNKVLVQRINGDGKIYVSGTQWGGLPAARIAISNWQADPDRDLPIVAQALLKAEKDI